MGADHPAPPTLFETPTETDEPLGERASPAGRSRSGRSSPPLTARTGRSSLSPVPSTKQNGRPSGTLGTASLPNLVDIPALAEHLGVTPRHVRRLVAERRIPYVRWGQLIRFDPEEIVRWLEQARVPGDAGA